MSSSSSSARATSTQLHPSSSNTSALARRVTLLKLAGFMDDAECDVLAYASFPKDHWPKIQSTNGIERLNGEIKRRTEVGDIFPERQGDQAPRRRDPVGPE